MSRWQPNTRERLESAALQLFTTQGFANTTVEQITDRAGLTTRTFFRHFTDKREVLFSPEAEVPVSVTKPIATTATNLMNLIEQGLFSTASKYEGRLEYLRLRQSIIDSDEGLRERELQKRENLSTVLIESFKQYGIEQLQATLAAKVAVSIFSTAMADWINQSGNKKLAVYVRQSLSAFYTII